MTGVLSTYDLKTIVKQRGGAVSSPFLSVLFADAMTPSTTSCISSIASKERSMIPHSTIKRIYMNKCLKVSLILWIRFVQCTLVLSSPSTS